MAHIIFVTFEDLATVHMLFTYNAIMMRHLQCRTDGGHEKQQKPQKEQLNNSLLLDILMLP